MYKNVLWIDPAVRDYQLFVDSVNADTLALVYPAELRFDVERIGFVFEKHGPMAAYLQANADLLIGSGVKHMDFLACDTLPEWEPYYDRLTGITVGASNNQTGNLQYGGDWLMESTCEDVESIYFTRSIQYYQYLLGDWSTTSIFKIGNVLWGIGDNTYNQLGTRDASPLTTFVDITSKQTQAFRDGTIVDFHYNQKSTIVTMSDGNVWMAGYSNDQYTKSSTFEFVKVKLTTDASGTKVVGKPILAKVGRVGLISDPIWYKKGIIWLITQSGTTYNLYIYAGDGEYTDGQSGAWNIKSSSTYFNLANSKWNDATVRAALEAGPITNIYIEQTYGTSRIFCTSTNVYISSLYTQNIDKGLLGNVTPAYGVDIPTYKLRTITTPTKAIVNFTPNYIYFLQNGNVYKDVNGYYTKCKAGGIEITGATHLASNNTFITVVTNNASVWTVNAPFTPTSTTTITYDSTTDFTLYPRNFGTITDIGMYNKGGINTLLIRSDRIIYNANISNIAHWNLDYLTKLTTFEPLSAPSKATLALYGDNFSNITFVKFGVVDASFTWISPTKVTARVPDVMPVSTTLVIYDATGTIYTYPDNFTNTTFTVTTFTPSSSIPYSFLSLNGTNFYNISAVLFGSVPSVFLWNSSINLSVQVPVNVGNVSIQVYDIYGNNTSYATNFTHTDLYATCFFGYFKPTIAGLHQFNVSSDHLVQLRLGDKTLYDLRTQGSILTLNASTVRNASVQLNTSYYPILLTYINAYPATLNPSVTIRNNVSFSGSAKALLPYCTLDKNTSGLYGYHLNGDQTRANLDVPVQFNTSLDRIYSPSWGFGASQSSVLTYWMDASSISLVEGPVPITRLNLSSVRVENKILTLQGTGIHPNVSVFLDGVPQSIFGVNVSILSNFSRVQLTDGLVQSNVYSMFGITSINTSMGIRNSSVLLYGYNLSAVNSVKFGPTNASFLLFSDRIQVTVPETTTQVLTVYDVNGASFVVTTFTIPPLFTITGLSKSSLIQNAPLTITGTNFSRIAYVQFADKTAIPINNTILVRVPEVVGNVSVTVVDVFNNRASIDGLNVSRKLSITSIDPVRAFPGYSVTVFGNDFYEVSANLKSYSYTVSTLSFSTPSTGGPIVLRDPYGNQASIAFTVINLSYAFQVTNQLTLVGQGLTDLNPGLPLFYPSDKAPMFTGKINGSVNVSREGYVTSTVQVVPVTAIRSTLQPDIVSVRGMPSGKIPDKCYTV